MRLLRRHIHILIPTLICAWIMAGCTSGAGSEAAPAGTDSGSPVTAQADSGADNTEESNSVSPATAQADSGADNTEESNSVSPATAQADSGSDGTAKSPTLSQPTGSLPLDYADEFSVDFYGDYTLITISRTDRYLLIPENEKAPSDLEPDIIPVRRPDKIYLAASAGMDYFRVLEALDKVRMTSTRAADWSLPEVVSALDSGDMIYVGKYSAPDYELLLSEGTDLAVESTMIYHNPDTKEKIEKLGIPVLVDKSSYEKHPLGRMEWIKLYGILIGKQDEAEAFYAEQLKSLEAIPELPQMNSNDDEIYSDGAATVSYFYITSSGSASIRRPGDYISRMIELAGGKYAFADLAVPDDNAQATMNMQMEAFLDRAMESDILIYSTSIDGGMNSLSDLYDKAPMLRQSRAAEDGNIWVTGKNMYQQTTAVAQMMLELHSVIAGDTDESQLEFLHRLN